MTTQWTTSAINAIQADYQRSADTHLIRWNCPFTGVSLYLKDESTHPTGSLKHRRRVRFSCTACVTAGSAKAHR